MRFIVWAALYVAWIAWHGNWWWLLGLPVVFEFCVSRRLKAWIDRLAEKSHALKVVLGWVDAILFAVIVVSFINIFFFQAFKIPSSSMESSLLTGDYLFVSKTAYGPKLPQTPLSVPFVHNTMPGSGKESYSTALQYGYKRIKGFGHVKRDDYVVFSFPHGDTVLSRAPAEDYYTHVRMTSRDYAVKTYGPVKVRPVDKKDHYVKRCVAVAGDTLSVVDGWVYVNGQPQERYPGIQNTYQVVTGGSPINPVVLRELGLNLGEVWYSQSLPGTRASIISSEYPRNAAAREIKTNTNRMANPAIPPAERRAPVLRFMVTGVRKAVICFLRSTPSMVYLLGKLKEDAFEGLIALDLFHGPCFYKLPGLYDRDLVAEFFRNIQHVGGEKYGAAVTADPVHYFL